MCSSDHQAIYSFSPEDVITSVWGLCPFWWTRGQEELCGLRQFALELTG